MQNGKKKMKDNLIEIQEFLKNKNLCLLGNSRSILKNKKDIDKFDIVCRINRGYSQGKEEYIGSRTDILFISTQLKENLRSKFNAKYVVWMTKSQGLATKWIKENSFQNPIEDWEELKVQYSKDKLPSTGCIALNFLIKYIQFKNLTIYGFDFFKSGTWYHNIKNQNWHDVDIEKRIILDLINRTKSNVEIIIE